MSALMLKMAADFLKITPEEIKENYERTIALVQKGIEALDDINSRLTRIEDKLEISEQVEEIENG